MSKYYQSNSPCEYYKSESPSSVRCTGCIGAATQYNFASRSECKAYKDRFCHAHADYRLCRHYRVMERIKDG
jgi:hypothetical protein